jgi:hypothetical protein
MWIGANAFVVTDIEDDGVSVSSDNTLVGRETFVIDQRTLYGLFLQPGTEYVIKTDKMMTIKTTELRVLIPSPLVPAYIGSDYPEPVVRQIILHALGDYLFTVHASVEWWARLLRLGVFVLDEESLVTVPNPSKKFCFLLDASPELAQNKWLDVFAFSVHTDTESMIEGLLACKKWHTRFGKCKSTWITDRFIKIFADISNSHYCSDIQFYTFKLTERNTNKVASWSLGYRYRNSFMDYTACTPIRDKRSAGKLLIRCEREFLQSSGVKLWYLGLELSYMSSLQGGIQLDRETFQSLWEGS